ncbi:putative Leucine-rich receptor-like kinase family protein [Quillaja saponaria]|uniref:Leucine-rich receptor-like kinase family protein n=1 Tax=Quillaja saponaria TaxID=32244 RepID=A0AAD7LJP7_QUISA|nr:putative Leucine-rich receptor-like kinase family protein [Quillaja saponaria]
MVTKEFAESSSQLVSLDVGDNQITGNIPSWIANLSSLKILILKGNHFMGQIPIQICQMTSLTIMDLSHNSLSGVIPSCLSNITSTTFQKQLGGFQNFSRELQIQGYDTRGLNPLLNLQEHVDFTTKMLPYTFYSHVLAFMTGMDLSHNKLEGCIPFEPGNLTNIHTLNLSHNYLTGQIPVSFSNLRQIESLDISFNRLNGRIPPQLTQLTTLSIFSVAHNNLSGPTADMKGQFSTSEESSYEGNPFLCGPQLHKSCTYNGEEDDNRANDGGFVDMGAFSITFAVSYVSVLVGIAAVLYINPYWRQAWFYFIELAITTCYYFCVHTLF